MNVCCWEILALSHMIACGDDPQDIPKSVLISDVIIKVGNSIMRDSQQSTQRCHVMHAVNIQWAIKENGTENIQKYRRHSCFSNAALGEMIWACPVFYVIFFSGQLRLNHSMALLIVFDLFVSYCDLARNSCWEAMLVYRGLHHTGLPGIKAANISQTAWTVLISKCYSPYCRIF